jgi:ankyrin repeat protein
MTKGIRLFVAVLALIGAVGCSTEQLQLPTPLRPSVEQELLLAAKRGDTVAVWAALATGTPPDYADDRGNTALTFAARDGHLKMAETLIAYGATVDWQDDEQMTPLMLAASRNHPEIANLLLSNGALLSIQDQWGRTALDYAERRGTDDPIAAMLR